MNIKITKKQKIGIGIFLLLLILVCSVIYFKNKSSLPDDEIKKNRVLVENVEVSEKDNEVDNNKKEDIENTVIKAYICGFVKNPGVYTLRKGDRLEDLVKLSGGFTNEADSKSINLASVVKDQDYFRILSKDEVVSSGNVVQNNIPQNSQVEEEEKININTATKEELKTLPRIGDALSDRIIDHRTNKGNFKNIEDLKDVSGIGDKMLENIKDKIKVE